MSNKSKNAFVKFFIDKSTGHVTAFTVSDSEDEIKVLDKFNTEDDVISGLFDFTPKDDAPFEGLGQTLIARTDIFRNTTPFLMSRMPLLISDKINTGFRKFVVDSGNMIDQSGEYQLYEIRKSVLSSQFAELEELKSLLAGREQLPNLFLIGLISAFDSFLSDMMRCILISKPEVISSSDKKLSLKDLLGVGSIKGAIERMIDKEIDAAMRGSHTDQIIWLEDKVGIKIREGNSL